MDNTPKMRWNDSDQENARRDKTRDRHGVKAQRKAARRAKKNRRDFESGKDWQE